MMKARWLTLVAVLYGLAASAWEYTVRKPVDALRPTFRAADTRPCVWTMNYEDAQAKAQAEGRYVIMFYTASWWCPYCETLEEMVLTSDAWNSYVKELGSYLVMLDFPYRYAVPAGQERKGMGPDGTGKPGWGFQCWLYDADYLADNGLTAEEGRQYIEKMYAKQNSMALPSADVGEFDNWNSTGKIKVGKVGYPTFVVFGPDGQELGRTEFPWYRSSDVTESEAQEYLIQQLEQIINGKCQICEDPRGGVPDVSAAQVYNGWLTDAKGGTVGTVMVKTSKMNGKAHTVKAKVSATLRGRRISFAATETVLEGCIVCGAQTRLKDLSVSNGNLTAKIGLGELGIDGTLNDGVETYAVSGGLVAKASLASCPVGNWSLVVKNDAGGKVSEFARGYGTLSLAMKKGGKAKVTGTLGDGTKVSVASMAVQGDGGVVCVPVRADLYSKKGGLGFVAWFKDGKLISIDDVSNWVAAGKREFSCPVSITRTMSPGMGTAPVELELTIADFSPEQKFGGLSLAEDPSVDVVKVAGRLWKGTDVTRFNARCNATTGELKGKITFRVMTANGRTKNVTGNFYGIVQGGAGYGTVIVNQEGSWAVKIAVCGSCSV